MQTTYLAISLLARVLLDRLIGEPRRWHPLAGFGFLAHRCEAWLRQGAPGHALGNRVRGLLGWGLLVLPLVALAVVCAHPLLDALLLGFALGGRSLAEHARAIATPLTKNQLDAARSAVGRIVSRETRTAGNVPWLRLRTPACQNRLTR